MRRPTALLSAALATVGAAAAATPASAAEPLPPFAFSSTVDGDDEIFVRRADGRTVQLTHNRTHDRDPAWSPDGRRLAYVSSADGDAEIMIMNADGSGRRQLTHNSTTSEGVPAEDFSPTWSPDGTMIAFVSNRQTAGGSQIYRMRADGSREVPLTRTPPYVTNSSPAWSPDGRHVAFGSDLAGVHNVEVYRMKADGSELRRLTRTADGIDDSMPEYSPDGRTLVFSSTRQGGVWDLFTMAPDGRQQTRLAGAPDLEEVFPQWTADGRRVMYMTFAPDEHSPMSVWIVDRDGSDRRQVSAGTADASLPDPHPRRG